MTPKISRSVYGVLCLALSVLMSCATQSKPKLKAAPQILQGPRLDPVQVESTNLEDNPQEALLASLKSRPLLVWIDSAGLDTFIALGFLQELEQKGLVPRALVGTGFGCWMAWSWALFGNGNRAEWQASKWDRWSAVERKSLWSRRQTERQRKQFEDDVSRWVGGAKPQLQVECPYYSQHDQRLFVGRRDSMFEKLWVQLQIPIFDENSNEFVLEQGRLSGLWAGGPQNFELDRMATILGYEPNQVRWLVLKTYSGRHQKDFEHQANTHFRIYSQSENEFKEHQSLSVSGSLTDFTQRRRYLLEGRQRAQSWWKKQFFIR